MLITAEKYKEIKELAYTLSTNLTHEEIIEHIKTNKFTNPDEQKIYNTTLEYPNDMEILSEYFEINKTNNIKTFPNKQICTTISQKLNIPMDIVNYKIMEYMLYQTPQLFSKNIELRRLAEQAPKSEVNIPDKPTK